MAPPNISWLKSETLMQEDGRGIWGKAMWTPLYSGAPSPPTQGVAAGEPVKSSPFQFNPLTSHTQPMSPPPHHVSVPPLKLTSRWPSPLTGDCSHLHTGLLTFSRAAFTPSHSDSAEAQVCQQPSSPDTLQGLSCALRITSRPTGPGLAGGPHRAADCPLSAFLPALPPGLLRSRGSCREPVLGPLQ